MSYYTTTEQKDEREQYILLLKRQVRDLHGLLKMRLRVDLPAAGSSATSQSPSVQILANLNERLLSFSEISSDFETLYSDLLERSKIANDCIAKASLYDSLLIKAKEAETAFKIQIDSMTSQTKLLDEDNSRLRSGLKSANEELLQRVEEVAKLRVSFDSLEVDLKTKTLELQRVTTDRDASKRQCLNLSSLLKQVAEEKEVKNQQIADLKQSLEAAENQLQEERFEAQAERNKEKLRREQQFAVKDQELDDEMAFLEAQLSSKRTGRDSTRKNHQILSSVKKVEENQTQLVQQKQSEAQPKSLNNNSSDEYPDGNDRDDGIKVDIKKQFTHQNNRYQNQPTSDGEEEQEEVDGDEEEQEEDDDNYGDDDDDGREGGQGAADANDKNSNHTASFGDSSNSGEEDSDQEDKKQEKPIRIIQNDGNSSESGEEEVHVNVDDAEFSENDSIDFEVKRRIQMKQQQQQNQQSQQHKQSQQLRPQQSVEPQKQVKKQVLLDLQSNASGSIEILKRTDLEELSRSSSEESLRIEAERARQLQKKRNQERFEMNKMKLVSSTSSRRTITSDDENN